MRPRSSAAFVVLLTLLVIASAALLSVQWRQTGLLRLEVERARDETRELTRLRAENERLRANQIPTAELERLRADHAALPRLRAELEALQRPTTAR
jgi:hypothetical protein